VDAGDRYRCLDVDETAQALVMLAQEPRKRMTPANTAAELPDVA
jgi:hypothetical protein